MAANCAASCGRERLLAGKFQASSQPEAQPSPSSHPNQNRHSPTRGARGPGPGRRSPLAAYPAAPGLAWAHYKPTLRLNVPWIINLRASHDNLKGGEPAPTVRVDSHGGLLNGRAGLY